MKRLILMLLLTSSCFASVVTTDNGDTKCYSVTEEYAAGMILKDMEIDFEKRVALFDLRAYRPLRKKTKVVDQKIFIGEGHPQFKEFTNLLQKDLAFLDEVCLADNGEVISFKR